MEEQKVDNRRNKGRKPGDKIVNRSKELVNAIFRSLDNHDGGIDGYMNRLRTRQPEEFNKLLAKVLPTKIANDDDDTFKIQTIERVIKNRNE